MKTLIPSPQRLFAFVLPLLFMSPDAALPAAEPATSTPGVKLIPYELKTPGQVSAAIYDAGGRLVRELLHAVPTAAGKHTLVWDGLDRDGLSLPAGDYTWKLLQTPGLQARYLMEVGSNYPPGTDWRTACGPGTHGAPHGIAVDDTGIYVAANTTENIETCVLKMTPDAKSRIWSALHPKAWDGALSLATDRGELYMLGHTADTDGRITLPKRQLVYVYDAAKGTLAKRSVVPTGVGDVPDKIDVHWDHSNRELDATDMDARDGVLVVVYTNRNALRWYDTQTGEKLDTVEIDSPQGVTIGDKGVVYVSSGDRILSVSRSNKQPVQVAAGLVQPGRLDVDHTSGQLFVYEMGTQQIKRLAADGKLLKTYGAASGRQDGLYDAITKRSFSGFADLCADGAGGFYVTESTSAPRRTAHFDQDGAVLREWYGGQRWAPHAAIEGDNPNVLWVGSQYGWIMRVLVDYDKQTWTVHSCYKYTGLASGLVGDSHNEGCYFRVYQHAGQTYIALEKMPTILKVDTKNWKLLPVTASGIASQMPKELLEWRGPNPPGSQCYQWNDANGDGMPQQTEMKFYPTGNFFSTYEPTIAADFSCFTVTHDKEGRQVRRFKVTEWNSVGAPIYGDLPEGQVFAPCSPRFDPQHYADPRWSVFLHQDPATGNLFSALNDWTRDWCDYNDSFMQKWSAEGKPLWTVGRRATGKALPGEIKTHLRGVAGSVHGCVVAIDVDGGWNLANLAVTYVWDQDGLYVGGLIDNPDLNGIEKHWYQCGGEHCHSSIARLPNGDVLFYGNWENEMRIYRITGWNDWTRQSGTVRVTQPAPAHTGQGLTATTFDDPAMTKLNSISIDHQVDIAWSAIKPAPAGIRWSGTVLPEYGPSYIGPWTAHNDKDCFESTVRGSRDDGATVRFRFKGASIAVIGRTGPNCGFATISLDGEPQPQADCYSAEVQRNVTLFSKQGLPEGDHEVTVTVLGWYGKPRNKASSDAWVWIDKFSVNDQSCDDAGLPYTFHTNADGQLQLWVNRTSILKDETARPTRAELTATSIKLLRTETPLQLSYTQGQPTGGVTLKWSNPFESLRPIPTQNLYPMSRGGYIMENLRYVGDLPQTKN